MPNYFNPQHNLGLPQFLNIVEGPVLGEDFKGLTVLLSLAGGKLLFHSELHVLQNVALSVPLAWSLRHSREYKTLEETFELLPGALLYHLEQKIESLYTSLQCAERKNKLVASLQAFRETKYLIGDFVLREL